MRLKGFEPSTFCLATTPAVGASRTRTSPLSNSASVCPDIPGSGTSGQKCPKSARLVRIAVALTPHPCHPDDPGPAAQARLKVSVHPVVVPETVQSARRCRIRSRLLLALAASAVLLALPGAALGAAPGSAGPAHLVDVFAGTAPGAGTFGGGHDFPGATVPFGMLSGAPTPLRPTRRGWVAMTSPTTTCAASASPT